MYLSPLTSVKQEIYRGKHPSGWTEKERSLEYDSPGNQLISPSKHRLLASLDRANPCGKSSDKSAGNQRSSLPSSDSSCPVPFSAGSETPQHSRAQSGNRRNGSIDREEDDQIARLKQKVRLLPITDADREEFWDMMRKYQKLQLQYRTSLMHNQSTPMGFNMEAAWSKAVCDRNRVRRYMS